MFLAICRVCEPAKRRFLVKKRTTRFIQKDSKGNIIVNEVITSKEPMCGKCHKDIKKMLDSK